MEHDTVCGHLCYAFECVSIVEFWDAYEGAQI